MNDGGSWRIEATAVLKIHEMAAILLVVLKLCVFSDSCL